MFGMRMVVARAFIVSILVLGGVLVTHAQTADELRQSIATKTAEIAKLEKEIDQYKNDLSKIATLKVTLKNLIASLDLTRKKLEGEIKITATKVDNTDLKIRQLESDITYKENQVEGLHAALTETVRAISERDSMTLTEIALSRESFSGLWNDIATMGQFNDSVQENVRNLKIIKADLEGKQAQREQERNALLNLKTELSDRKKVAEQNKKEQSALLTQTNNQESTYTKLLKQKIALKESFEKELSDYESTLKFILDPSSIPPRGTKVFSMPLDKVVITQKFGKTSSSGRLYASGTHNGVDFGTPTGTQVKAVLAGTVIGTGDTDIACPGASYGKWVLIRHNNGLATLYAHFSLIKATTGSTVNTGDLIGYSGNTGYSTGPHLHLTAFVAKAVTIESRPSKACGGRVYTMPVAAFNAYLDPLDYL